MIVIKSLDSVIADSPLFVLQNYANFETALTILGICFIFFPMVLLSLLTVTSFEKYFKSFS